MLKLSENPAILSPEVQSLAELKGTWWIVYTKARFEKALAWDLFNHEIGYFLPMREKVIFSGGRKRRIMLPLFTSYVFLCGTESDRYTAMKTNRICHTIEVLDQDRLINELVSIEKALLNHVVIDNYNSLSIGTHCRITSGPMMGIEGKVVEKYDLKARMVLEVTILGQGALVEVDSDLLETIS
ncbi:MAG: UpxY family transcription antiterminator [Bacteroidales bacterium]|nr:UpxY family transcription antiterminator [Bacteroidales bacterium]